MWAKGRPIEMLREYMKYGYVSVDARCHSDNVKSLKAVQTNSSE